MKVVESQPAVSSSQQQTDVKQKTKTKTQQTKDSSNSSAQGLATLKSLIAKAAAGTLNSKSSTTKSSTTEAAAVKNENKTEKPLADDQPKTNPTKTTSTSTSTGTHEDVGIQENDYWMEEKLKMQNKPAYQSFQKGAMLKKSLTSKGTSPPPQTISTQVLL